MQLIVVARVDEEEVKVRKSVVEYVAMSEATRVSESESVSVWVSVLVGISL